MIKEIDIIINAQIVILMKEGSHKKLDKDFKQKKPNNQVGLWRKKK